MCHSLLVFSVITWNCNINYIPTLSLYYYNFLKNYTVVITFITKLLGFTKKYLNCTTYTRLLIYFTQKRSTISKHYGRPCICNSRTNGANFTLYINFPIVDFTSQLEITRDFFNDTPYAQLPHTLSELTLYMQRLNYFFIQKRFIVREIFWLYKNCCNQQDFVSTIPCICNFRNEIHNLSHFHPVFTMFFML